MEIAILKPISQERKKSHFTTIVDRGKKENYLFLVMELVGKSLVDLKSYRPGRVFSISTGLGASIQHLEACEDLHKYGFIYRDFKPANYASGLKEKERICTTPFASISCHKNVEMGAKDDFQSWFYLLIDITFPNGEL
ncbi:unnamed protein product [Angiostrongylus costaricensis]|uniref:Protein kinase domain-containing protein n=1 Tax=Angiostrongylus costaricensis TaxID=334426 RepID=A0A0R3Q167_ANGCS|nr:unnamed protein product [Angiostrongylus costaricensis]